MIDQTNLPDPVRTLEQELQGIAGSAEKLFAVVNQIKTQLDNARQQRDQAITEANKRDQKWMDGINEIVGRKLDYGDPCSPNAASKGLEDFIKAKALLAEALDALQELRDWQNGPPLLSEKWTTGWGNAMAKADAVLEKAKAIKP